MGILRSELPWQQLQLQDYFHYRVKVIKYSRKVHKVISYLKFVNVLSKRYFLCSKPKKKRHSWAQNISQQRRGASQFTQDSWRPRGQMRSLTSEMLSKTATCSRGRHHLHLTRLAALQNPWEASPEQRLSALPLQDVRNHEWQLQWHGLWQHWRSRDNGIIPLK